MTVTEVVLYLGSSFVSGYCLGFGVYAWRKFMETF